MRNCIQKFTQMLNTTGKHWKAIRERQMPLPAEVASFYGALVLKPPETT
jgi:hypothetical protein